jgi:hypothetical protein
MEFFNQKEEVIDIKLTQYGKRMLKAGNFKPSYYAFFDKDILYNRYGDAREPELQNQTEPRIREETPRLKVQNNFIGVETQFNEMKEIITFSEKFSKFEMIQKLQDTDNTFFSPNAAIANTKLGNQYRPSWDLSFYNENLQSVTGSLTSSNSPTINIPQLNATLNFTTLMSNATLNLEESTNVANNDYSSDLEWFENEPLEFEDGSIIIMKDDFLLIGIDEKNTDFLSDNFEIEVFKIEETKGEKAFTGLEEDQKKTKLIPLQFLPSRAPGQSDMFDEEELEIKIGNPNYVEYFFDLLIDSEIPEGIFCKKVGQDEKSNLYVKQIFNCDETDFSERQDYNIYDDDDLGEPCE